MKVRRKMITVQQILQKKGGEVWTIGPQVTVFDALKLMAEKEIGALLVVETGKVVGIFSERDYARKVILKGRSSKDTPVRKIMTERVITVDPNTTVEVCMGLMTDRHIRHLPVIEDDRLIGVISIGDVVKVIITEQTYLIEHLENYIAGR
jgi:CBS domain-containing protein